MKRIRSEELPIVLNDEVLNILVEMALEFPKTTSDWVDVSEVLKSRGQLNIVLNKVAEISKARQKDKMDSMSEEEKAEDAAKWEKIKNDPDPYKFYGNMGQPETPQEFKNRYGVWPPGYDENGKKLA